MNEKDEREQMEAMRVLAKSLRAFYDGLIEQKFTPMEALALTRSWISRRAD